MATARMVGLQHAKQKMKEKSEQADMQQRNQSAKGSVLPANSPQGRFTPSTPFEDGDDAAGGEDETHHSTSTGGCFEGAKAMSIPQWYENYAEKSKDIVNGSKFSNFIIGIIVLAGVLVGIQMYEGMEDEMWVIVTDNVVLGIFCVEVILKTVAEGGRPWRYFTGPEWQWNNFDFVIVFFCLPWPFMQGSTSSIKILRLLRLMRVLKLVRKIPQLQMIVMGLIGGLKSIGYIILLLFLVFYIYGILGVVAFGKNDPWHFGTLEDALNSLFRMATLEDWTDIMYINMYGCGHYDGGGGTYYVLHADKNVAPGDSVIDDNGANQTNFYGAIKNPDGTDFDGMLCVQHKHLCGPPGTLPSNPTAQLQRDCRVWELGAPQWNATRSAWDYASGAMGAIVRSKVDGVHRAGWASAAWFSTVYCVTFILISALVMLSLFIGAVTMSMTESMEEMKVEGERKQRKARMAKAAKEARRRQELAGRASKELQASSGSPDRAESESPQGIKVKALSKLRTTRRLSQHSIEEVNKQARMRAVLLKAWDGVEIDVVEFVDPSIGRVPWRRNYNALAKKAETIANAKWFENTITSVILVAGVLVGAQTYAAVDSGPVLGQGGVIDFLILLIFTIEVVVKVIAQGFDPLHYFAGAWNRFDFFIVLGSWLGKGGLLGNAGALLVVLRLLRLLRVLKLVKSLPQLQVIVIALMKGFKSIGYIGIILLMCFYLFAICAMILFSENDPWHFGTLHLSMISLFRASTLEDWTDIMYINMYGCASYGYNLDSTYNRTGEWGMYDSVLGCNHPLQWPTKACFPDCSKGYGLLAALFFVIFIVIGALVLLTLFIGVVTTSMEEASEGMKAESDMDDAVQAAQQECDLPDEQIELYREVFGMLDVDKDGRIMHDELKMGLQAAGRHPSDHTLRDLIAVMDKDGSGSIDLAEFVLFMHHLSEADNVSAESSAMAQRISFIRREARDDEAVFDRHEHPSEAGDSPAKLTNAPAEGAITPVAKPRALGIGGSSKIAPSG